MDPPTATCPHLSPWPRPWRPGPRNIRINLAALVASFHDPLRLAEDIAVVDLISEGRLDLVLTNGYVGEEFAMFDQPIGRRARRTTEAGLRAPPGVDGRTVRVPGPDGDGHPPPLSSRAARPSTWAGAREPAARRAARIADGFMPSTPAVWDFYRDEVHAVGASRPRAPSRRQHRFRPPGIGPRGRVAAHRAPRHARGQCLRDLDGGRGHLRHRRLRARRRRRRPSGPPGSTASSRPDQMVAELSEQGPFAFVAFHPLMGGIPPELAWESLRLFEHEVLPRL